MFPGWFGGRVREGVLRQACGSAKASGSSRHVLTLIGDCGVIVIMFTSLDVMIMVVFVVAVTVVVAAAGSVGVVVE